MFLSRAMESTIRKQFLVHDSFLKENLFSCRGGGQSRDSPYARPPGARLTQLIKAARTSFPQILCLKPTAKTKAVEKTPPSIFRIRAAGAVERERSPLKLIPNLKRSTSLIAIGGTAQAKPEASRQNSRFAQTRRSQDGATGYRGGGERWEEHVRLMQPHDSTLVSA